MSGIFNISRYVSPSLKVAKGHGGLCADIFSLVGKTG
jgi:hypothetical protein